MMAVLYVTVIMPRSTSAVRIAPVPAMPVTPDQVRGRLDRGPLLWPATCSDQLYGVSIG